MITASNIYLIMNVVKHLTNHLLHSSHLTTQFFTIPRITSIPHWLEMTAEIFVYFNLFLNSLLLYLSYCLRASILIFVNFYTFLISLNIK